MPRLLAFWALWPVPMAHTSCAPECPSPTRPSLRPLLRLCLCQLATSTSASSLPVLRPTLPTLAVFPGLFCEWLSWLLSMDSSIWAMSSSPGLPVTLCTFPFCSWPVMCSTRSETLFESPFPSPLLRRSSG